MADTVYLNILRQQRVRETIVFLAGLTAGMWFIAFNAVDVDLLYFPGDLGDARFNNYLLEHAHRFFMGQDPSFWSAPFMYPEKDVISYSDNLVGTAPFYSFFRLIGADRETAFQYWYLLLCVFNYTSAYFFLRYLSKNAMAATLGAMIFAFSIALQSQIGHAQTYPRFMIPLALWAAVHYHRELKVKFLFLSLIAWVYQMYCGIYLGFMLLIPLVILFAVGFILRKKLYRLKFRSVRWVVLSLLSVVLNLGLLLILMIPYIERAKTLGLYPYKQVITTLPTLTSYVYSSAGSLFWDVLMNVGNDLPYSWDFRIFPGGIALLSFVALLVIVLRDAFRGKRKAWLSWTGTQKLVVTCLGLTALFFLQVQGASLYRILHYVPGFASMRALQRIINIELLLFAAAVTFVSALFLKNGSRLSTFLFSALVILVILDNRIPEKNVFKVNKQEAQRRINDLVEKVRDTDKNAILSYERDTVEYLQYILQIDGMMTGQTLGRPTLNGYSATAPVGFDAYWVKPNEVTRRVWLEKNKMPEDRVVVYR